MRILWLIPLVALAARAQQPFLTDDADVAETHHVHLEIVSEHDALQRSAYPTLRQNTTRLQVTYGILDRVEIGFDGPLLFIYNDHLTSPNAYGFGDLDFQMKFNFHRERQGSALPALTFGLYIEAPTGNRANQLGSGIADYWLNSIAQKTLSERWTLRVNSGVLFSGNTLTGAIGIRAVRGVVFTGASSLTYQATGKLLIGGELAGALTSRFDLSKAQLQGLFGAKYQLTKKFGLDFALTGGKFEGSPRVGGAFGFSLDF